MSTFPLIAGHRGAAESAPENTLAAIREAARQGVAWVELDVMLSGDGVPVLIHDETLDRTTNGTGPVTAASLADLRRLDAGSWFDARFCGETIPTLDEAIDLLVALGLGLDLEIKPFPGQDAATAAAAVAALLRRWPQGGPALLVSSFSPACLAVAQDVAPALPRGLLLWETPDDWPALADHVGAATIIVNHEFETAASVAAFRAGGRPVLAYTVNDPDRARTLLGWGIAGVITDAPGRLAAGIGVS